MIKKSLNPNTSYSVIFGHVIAQKRKDMHKDQADAAKESGLNRSTWSRMEHGEYVPDALQLRKIADVLGIPAPKLLSDIDNTCEKLKETGVQVSIEKSTLKSNNNVGLFLTGAVLGALIATLISGGKGGGK